MAGAPSQQLKLGFDAGSIALKLVVTDTAGRIIEQSYTRTLGRPVETALDQLSRLVSRYGNSAFGLAAGTGSAGRLICELLGAACINEVICQATAVRHLVPSARTVIEMGGQDSKLILLPEDPAESRPMVDFTMNTNCAAGTGSFLDQQASRLGIRIEDEFGELALKSLSPPRVAGRCSVFAKSDMIHLQQQAAPVHDIVAGLCMGLARNLKSNLGRGMQLPRPIVFCGGVAANKGVAHALRQVLELAETELIVPECHACTGALGAILVATRERLAHPDYARLENGRLDLSRLSEYLERTRSVGRRLAKLAEPSDGHARGELPSRSELAQRSAQTPIDAWLGLDVGSISTKAAVIDSDNRVLAKIYLMTAGRPLEAVRSVMSEIGRQVNGHVRIRGAATTGSGRYLTGDFVGADLVVNEITSQATAAAAIDPQVDTIFEIGGQDSKYISLDRGVVVDFEMNHACAAGTGSFLEEQSERLGVNIKQQFAQLALASDHPIRLGERCTVFMESDLLSYQQQGAQTADLVAGLCYSIVTNYINRVVAHRRIGKRIFFQGGTAFNRGVVSAFEKVTGRPITVPAHHEVTGAIGAALLARQHQQRSGRTESAFRGFDAADVQYEIRSFECDKCSNNCEINEVTIPGRQPLYYGSRCDRYNLRKDQARQHPIPNLFAERQRLLLQHANLSKDPKPGRPTIGIPLALSNYQLLPLWATLLGELGFNVLVSDTSTPAIVHRGVEAVLSTPCFPVKVMHGHVLDLLERGVDMIWMPSVLSMPQDYAENGINQFCPYVTSIPYQLKVAIEATGKQPRLLVPEVRLQDGPRGLLRALKQIRREFPGATPALRNAQLRSAVAKAWQAQEAFELACRQRGAQVLRDLSPYRRAVVIVSRPYNGCDTGVCLDLPNKLRKLGILPIPLDFLDLNEPSTGDRILQGMYWKYGQRILHAARLIRKDPRLHAIYLSNFSCGPDSFLINFFKRLMTPKPSLVLEIDEHSADAGVVTRLEAFLDSLDNAPADIPPRTLPLSPLHATNGHRRKVYIPWMGDYAYALAAAFRACGSEAEVIPIADEQSLELGRRFCSGKECLPCIITSGDMVRVTQRPDFDPDRSAFFMPGGTGPCRFGQYSQMHRLILDDLGLPQVPIMAPTDDAAFYDELSDLGEKLPSIAWWSICSVEMLVAASMAIRPYELNAGETDRIYEKWRNIICEAVAHREKDQRIVDLLACAAREFAAIPADRARRKPRIGVVGEIYVRQHSLANNNLIRSLEQLGAEAHLAGLTEYIYYTNWTRMGESRRAMSLRPWLGNFLQNYIQRRIHQRVASAFHPVLGHYEEPPTTRLLKHAEPYLRSTFEGEAVLSVGKMIDLRHEGCHGIVNVMPFTCMPSTIVGSLTKKLAADFGQMPILSISYDGQQDSTLQTRLEAFIYQARMYQATTERPMRPQRP